MRDFISERQVLCSKAGLCNLALDSPVRAHFLLVGGRSAEEQASWVMRDVDNGWARYPKIVTKVLKMAEAMQEGIAHANSLGEVVDVSAGDIEKQFKLH